MLVLCLDVGTSCFGQGPCISIDVEGASSLVAVNYASANLSRTGNWDPIPFALCNSWNLQLTPAPGGPRFFEEPQLLFGHLTIQIVLFFLVSVEPYIMHLPKMFLVRSYVQLSACRFLSPQAPFAFKPWIFLRLTAWLVDESLTGANICLWCISKWQQP